MQDEIIRLSPFSLEGKQMVDVRYWKQTKKGPRPTQRGVSVEMKLVPRVVAAFQTVYSNWNSEESKKLAGIEG